MSRPAALVLVAGALALTATEPLLPPPVRSSREPAGSRETADFQARYGKPDREFVASGKRNLVYAKERVTAVFVLDSFRRWKLVAYLDAPDGKPITAADVASRLAGRDAEAKRAADPQRNKAQEVKDIDALIAKRFAEIRELQKKRRELVPEDRYSVKGFLAEAAVLVHNSSLPYARKMSLMQSAEMIQHGGIAGMPPRLLREFDALAGGKALLYKEAVRSAKNEPIGRRLGDLAGLTEDDSRWVLIGFLHVPDRQNTLMAVERYLKYADIDGDQELLDRIGGVSRKPK